MSLWHILGLIVVALLVSFLRRSHEAKVCRRVDERNLAVRGIDVTPVSERIRHVREDYLAVVSARHRDRRRCRQLHAAARRALKQRAYFRHARTEAKDLPRNEAPPIQSESAC